MKTEKALQTILDGLQRKTADIAEEETFRTEAITLAQAECDIVDPDLFFEAFNKVSFWMEKSIAAAPGIVAAHKNEERKHEQTPRHLLYAVLCSALSPSEPMETDPA